LQAFQVTEEVMEDLRLVAIRGELDAVNAPQIEAPLDNAATDRQRSLVVDLSQCEFVDSSGLAALLHGIKPLQNGETKVALVCPEGSVRELLRLTAIDQTVPVFDGLEDAKSAALASD
jgi:anti-sigma B factor antagonist